MTEHDEQDYYVKRALEERQKSKEAANLPAALSHERLAVEYEYMARIAARAKERQLQVPANDLPHKAN